MLANYSQTLAINCDDSVVFVILMSEIMAPFKLSELPTYEDGGFNIVLLNHK